MKRKAEIEAILQTVMKKKGPLTDTERVLKQFGNLLKRLARLEAQIGKTEDKLGLSRSRANDPWDDRLRRIRKRRAQIERRKEAGPQRSPRTFTSQLFRHHREASASRATNLFLLQGL